MNVSIFVKAAFLFSFISSFLWGSAFNKKNDIQLWELQKLSVELNSITSFYFQTEFRWGDDISVLYVHYFQGGIVFVPCEWLEVAPAYRQLTALRRDHTHNIFYEPLLDVTLKRKLREWAFQNRFRFQYRIPESGTNEWIYRDRLKVNSPWKWGKLKFNPFVFDEVFFSETRGFSENRFAAGGGFTLAKSIQSDLYYMLRHIQFPNWRPTHVIGMNLYFKY